MQGESIVLTALNDLVSAELGTRDQWLLFARITDNWGLHKLSAHLMGESAEEGKHAQKLIDRMIFLEEVPSMTPTKVASADSLKKMFDHSLELELDAVTNYRTVIQLCLPIDPVTRSICEQNLVDEENHVNWLEEQIYLMEKMGLECYMQTQI